MTTLVVGATGATGQLLVKQLLERGEQTKVIVRSPGKLSEAIKGNEKLSVIEASILDMEDDVLREQVAGCNAIASCLGHNVSFKGMYGHPRKLVTDAAKMLCEAVIAQQRAQPVKYVLMNTAGNSNRDLDEQVSLREKSVLSLIRLLIPPHIDNEQAADYLRVEVGQNNPHIEWVVVRPDNLINDDNVTDYELHPSPIRSAIFDPGTTSRINVAHFMADLITNEVTWEQWKGQMPLIYNRD